MSSKSWGVVGEYLKIIFLFSTITLKFTYFLKKFSSFDFLRMINIIWREITITFFHSSFLLSRMSKLGNLLNSWYSRTGVSSRMNSSSSSLSRSVATDVRVSSHSSLAQERLSSDSSLLERLLETSPLVRLPRGDLGRLSSLPTGAWREKLEILLSSELLSSSPSHCCSPSQVWRAWCL